MMTGELKNRIDRLWDAFAAGGLVNPLEVIEQVTYLMLIHDLDIFDRMCAEECAARGAPYKSVFSNQAENGSGGEPGGEQLRWSVFCGFPEEVMYTVVRDQVFPFIRTLHNDKNSAYFQYMADAVFKLPSPSLLSKTVASLEGIYQLVEPGQDSDLRGDIYEYLLSRLSQSGRNGQFRTPRHIIRMMVELMEPKPEDTICDPACGTSGFLVEAAKYLKENYKEDIFFHNQAGDNKTIGWDHMFYGYDMDRTMLRIGAMNMMAHGVKHPQIEYCNSLSDQNSDQEKYSLVLANPPFKGMADTDDVSPDLLKVCKTKKSELLFLAVFLRMMKVGGRCACIVPDGVLFGTSAAHKAIRRELVEENRLEAVISMPPGVFRPYTGVSTGILVFTKTARGETDKVWFYDMEADGKSLDDKRLPVAENDIPDVINRFRHRYEEKGQSRTGQSFFVGKEEIAGQEYDLSVMRYKEIDHVPVKYPPVGELLDDLRRIETEIAEQMGELEKILKEI